MHDSGISEEDLDALLKDAERIKLEEDENGRYSEQPHEEHQFTPEDEALMDSIAENPGYEEEGQMDHLAPGEADPERTYTPEERALMESIQEEEETDLGYRSILVSLLARFCLDLHDTEKAVEYLEKYQALAIKIGDDEP